jgi:acyl-CoA thioesterase
MNKTIDSKITDTSATEMARACADALWVTDTASQGVGMEILDVGPGYAKLAMTLTAAMANGHGLAHGGYIFTLADSTFAFACNTYNERAVAAQCNITYLRPGKVGHRLTAVAREVARAGRSGIYDVTISDGDVTIAEFRGHSRLIGGALLAKPNGSIDVKMGEEK